MEHKRLTLFAGHYGSGKTNIAVNYALRLAKEGKTVCVADLDIVNPYFRTKDSEEDFKAHGISLICSKYANSNVDLPALPAESYRLVQDKSCFGVIDIGGDDRGAYALGIFGIALYICAARCFCNVFRLIKKRLRLDDSVYLPLQIFSYNNL